LGYRTKIVGGVTANYSQGAGIAPTERYYFDEQGKIPYQMYYPGVDGVWPIHRYRLLWTWFWERRVRRDANSNQRWGTEVIGGGGPGGVNAMMRGEDAWSGTRLPSIAAKGTGGKTPYRSHRWAVPVERDMTRVCYINIERYQETPSTWTRIYKGFTWPFRNWSHNFNFRYADLDAERTCQYNIPEYLSATDSTVVVIRKVLTDYARGVKSAEATDGSMTREEELVTKHNLEALETSSSVFTDRIKQGLSETGLGQ
jgi:hypothetical protein